MKQLDILIAEKLLQASAIKLQPDSPFVWGSGWNSPMYNDHQQILSHPSIRNMVKVEMSRIIVENFDQVDVVAGVATGAIALGAIVADALGLPYVYVREKAKDHGLENLIEGNIKAGQRVVIIEDLLSTGRSCLKATQAIRDAGGVVVGAVALFNYEFPVAAKALKKEKLVAKAITNYSAMIKAALASGRIKDEDVVSLKKWHDDPENWMPGDIFD
ncbi:MAG: orotate phosphoribosyltransferase [Muribaculaceae bacterium]|nr:orotate phosphoribosyltransferase [Muribaculaceae bacterium]MBR3101681.1 orotate phosphoribosyltransferase [Muribaculaceae bacterium]